jgi:hypothetical protein
LNPSWYIDFDGAQAPRNLTLKYIEVDGINMLPERSGACLQVETPFVTFDDILLRNCGGNGFHLFASNLTVRNSQVLNCGRIQQPGAADTKGLGFYISPARPDGSNKAENNVWEYNTVDGCRGGGGVIHYGTSDNNIVRFSIFKNAGTYSPHPDPGGNYYRNAAGVNIGGAGFFNSNIGPRFNRIYSNIFYNIKNSNEGVGHTLWGASDNSITNNTYYNLDYGFFLSCDTTNGNYDIRNNIWSQVGQTDNTAAVRSCGASITGSITNNLHNPNVATTFVDAAAGDFRLLTNSGATAAGAGATMLP